MNSMLDIAYNGLSVSEVPNETGTWMNRSKPDILC
jgi:hypothetical protein